jgi:putative transcriptional regulator
MENVAKCINLAKVLEESYFRGMKRMRSRLRILMAEYDPPLTQTQLIEQLGLGNHTISKLFNNTFRRVDTDTVEKLCSFFNCGIADLFELKEVPSDSSRD